MRRPPLPFVVAVLVLAILGAVLLAVADDRIGLEAAGMVVLGVAGILAVAGVFYLVGAAEDDERKRRGP